MPEYLRKRVCVTIDTRREKWRGSRVPRHTCVISHTRRAVKGSRPEIIQYASDTGGIAAIRGERYHSLRLQTLACIVNGRGTRCKSSCSTVVHDVCKRVIWSSCHQIYTQISIDSLHIRWAWSTLKLWHTTPSGYCHYKQCHDCHKKPKIGTPPTPCPTPPPTVMTSGIAVIMGIIAGTVMVTVWSVRIFVHTIPKR